MNEYAALVELMSKGFGFELRQWNLVEISSCFRTPQGVANGFPFRIVSMVLAPPNSIHMMWLAI